MVAAIRRLCTAAGLIPLTYAEQRCRGIRIREVVVTVLLDRAGYAAAF
jgi:hypothetical protein